MKKIKFNNYNDGVVEFGDYLESYDSEGNALKEKEFINKGRLFFSYETIREQDKLKYDDTGFKVSIKIKTHYLNSLKSNHVIKLDNTFYSIVKIDPSKDKQSLYIYLTDLIDTLNIHISIYKKFRKGVLEDATWNLYRTLWSRAEEIKSKELIEADSLKISLNKKFTIRYLDILDPAINKKASTEFSIEYKNNTYNMLQIINVDEENQILEIIAESK